MTSQKLYDIIAFSVMQISTKSMPQFLLLNALYPLALITMEKDISCVSCSGLVTYQIWS